MLSFVAYKTRLDNKDYEFRINNFLAKSKINERGKSIYILRYCIVESTDINVRNNTNVRRQEKIESILENKKE
jgi:hypothetical protein